MAVNLRVNGRREVGLAEPRVTLAEFLREELGLTGTHVGCEQGCAGPARSSWTGPRSAAA